MARGAGVEALARVAVLVRAGAVPLFWPGLVAGGAGAFVPGLTGRWIGLYAGLALFLLVALTVFFVRRGRYAELAASAGKAPRSVILQDRAVTVRAWRRAHRWWLVLAFCVAAGANFAVPGALGLAFAGAGFGLWAKSLWLGGRERTADVLLWVSPDAAARRGGPAGRQVGAYRTTGIGAGDARPGGTRRAGAGAGARR
ncbi:hypothetical protein SRB5_68060 [Streptomyces sp. RB5]|uniref:Integral membrane protein n=1 Tax=Streptomyces smaragdinus TaxID=2585196 RepID=A0A7K0CVC0_9ACTN|nr:hypothetical protein [Streptomyces smaragdinus]MQY16604.1 hypothetical protein [Streptomyces smaragdinus]